MKSKRLREDIISVVDYLWHDEEKHYEEVDRPRNHIFMVLKRLAKEIGYKTI